MERLGSLCGTQNSTRTSRAIVDPTVLTKPKVLQPASFACAMAASVSAVSPDCEIAITMSLPGRRIGLRYRNSDAYSTSTGTRQRSSMRYSPTCKLSVVRWETGRSTRSSRPKQSTAADAAREILSMRGFRRRHCRKRTHHRSMP